MKSLKSILYTSFTLLFVFQGAYGFQLDFKSEHSKPEHSKTELQEELSLEIDREILTFFESLNTVPNHFLANCNPYSPPECCRNQHTPVIDCLICCQLNFYETNKLEQCKGNCLEPKAKRLLFKIQKVKNVRRKLKKY